MTKPPKRAKKSTREVPLPPEQCSGCRFWIRATDDQAHGRCRRHAPRPEHEPRPRYWPRTMEDDWCGEFEKVTSPPLMQTLPSRYG